MATRHGHELAMQIIRAALVASNPRAAVAAAVKSHPPHSTRPAVIAIGKAAAEMYQGLLDALPEPPSRFMVVPEGTSAPTWGVRADHPLPTPRCVKAATALAEFVRTAQERGECNGFIVLVSGGASSLITWPFESIPLDLYASAIETLLKSGRSIQEINTVRKHCERLKGGRLAVLMHPLPCDAYLLSDVIGDDPSSIGSGPTVPDPTTLDRLDEFFPPDGPRADRFHPRTFNVTETPKPDDPRLANSHHTIVGSNVLAVHAAEQCARHLGFDTPTPITGVIDDAGAAGSRLGSLARNAAPNSAIIFGGETVVRVSPGRGRGGRNQHLALSAAIEIDGCPGVTIATFATDGVDGPTDAAGAIVTGDTCRLARQNGLDPAQFLRDHDSFTFFDSLDRLGHQHLIRTGPTGTNVNDIAFALIHETEISRAPRQHFRPVVVP